MGLKKTLPQVMIPKVCLPLVEDDILPSRGAENYVGGLHSLKQTAKAPEKRPSKQQKPLRIGHPKGKGSSSNHKYSGAMFSFREGSKPNTLW